MSGRIIDLTIFALLLFRFEIGTEFEPGRDPKSSPGAHKIKNAMLIGRIFRLSYLSVKGLAGSATLIATEYGISVQAEIQLTNQRRPMTTQSSFPAIASARFCHDSPHQCT
jgi:hypothetical protein